MSSTLTAATSAASTGGAPAPRTAATPPRAEPSSCEHLSPEQRSAILEHLELLASYETERVERVATMGLPPVAAYEMGMRDAVRDAIRKLADGTFGQCETCQHPIPPARLEALPYARRCLMCQQREETGWNDVERVAGHAVRTHAGEPQGRKQQ